MNNIASAQTVNPSADQFSWIAEVFKSVSGLVAAGGNGLAGIIFVAVMVVIVASLAFGARMNKDMIGLTKWYLVLGTVCVALSLAVGVVERFMGATYDLYVSASPSFATVGYPDPIVRADTTVVALDQKFKVNRGMGINVIFDQTIEFVKKQNAELVAAHDEVGRVTQNALQLQSAVEAQNQQLAAVEASFDTFRAGITKGADMPDWAGIQLNSIASSLKSIKEIEQPQIVVRNEPNPARPMDFTIQPPVSGKVPS